ncbi:uncharacterized protein LOC110620936 [Manihot esculenta]|uniref:uncharacterized protein LOC110620936 n=1 Tax=Manihot esculenta TaxID=3983 RepID=UPI001CC7F650|nr:uncharacterized protein LOC110620936 [Manihot esculenta]
MSSKTALHMVWHASNQHVDGSMVHPVDSEAWKHFDRTHSWFASDPRNVRLGLCTNGFNPFGQRSKPYSCWPVIVVVYNLPPWMAMKKPYMFLNMVIPGPKSPGKSLDVFLRPLIDELKLLWHEGVWTHDANSNQNFQMKAALLWTISDFPAYGILSGWSTHGRMSCPYCMENSKAFILQHGGKPSFFYCHRQFLPINHPYRRQKDKFRKGFIEKTLPPSRMAGDVIQHRVNLLSDVVFGTTAGKQTIPGFGVQHNWVKKSIFWELPYWQSNLLRHNLDVMHIEKNVFDNIFYTVMDVNGKSKDNIKARQDLKVYCNRPELELLYNNGKVYKPKATYSLNKEQKRSICQWLKDLRLPDGYASNITQSVSVNDCKFYGLKSHDCHILMQRLIPIAFRDILPKAVWDALTELSHFFRDITATTLTEENLNILEKNIVESICKMEKIFPPGFFDSMEHLPIHLAYEAKVGGPVQYRWMYPFERYLFDLKKKVKNKASVEGSIVEAYLIEENSSFCSHYFEPSISTRLNRVPRNDDGGHVEPMGRLSIFTHAGRPFGQLEHGRMLSNEE